MECDKNKDPGELSEFTEDTSLQYVSKTIGPVQPFFPPSSAGNFDFGAALKRLWRFWRRAFHLPIERNTKLPIPFFCNQFDRNEDSFAFEFSSAGIKIGVRNNSAGLNNLGWPLFELGYSHEKFGVLTGPMKNLVSLWEKLYDGILFVGARGKNWANLLLFFC